MFNIDVYTWYSNIIFYMNKRFCKGGTKYRFSSQIFMFDQNTVKTWENVFTCFILFYTRPRNIVTIYVYTIYMHVLVNNYNWLIDNIIIKDINQKVGYTLLLTK